MPMQIASIVVDFCRRLDRAGIPYLIGGSVASGVWGEPRQTNDVDIEIWLTKDNVEAFLAALKDDYLVSETEARKAVSTTDQFPSVQALHIEEVFKFDCFVERSTPIDQAAYKMAADIEASPGSFVKVASVERIFVQKLRWYELGNRASEKQWRDLIGIVKRSRQIDWELVTRWAEHYGVTGAMKEVRKAAESRE